MIRTKQCIDKNWRLHHERDGEGYNIEWTRQERELLSNLKSDVHFDGIFWPKAGRCNGPAGVKFDDGSWPIVDLPHDWSVEQAFSREAPVRNAFLPLAVLWYRKSVFIPNEAFDKRVVLTFDGAFRNATVFVNGHLVGQNESGYVGFSCDISDVIDTGRENQIAVRLDARKKEGWFYEGAGIYRHVWLTISEKTHLVEDGISVIATLENELQTACVSVKAEMYQAEHDDGGLTLTCILRSPDGREIAHESKIIAYTSDSIKTEEMRFKLSDPECWDLNTPRLYTAELLLLKDGEKLDFMNQEFGIRSILFDADKGFFLNGKSLKLKGVCCHQDHAGVGMAIPDNLHVWRLKKLKEMGVNAYRCSHNPMAPEFYSACDRMGILVMDENRCVGSSGEVLDQLTRMIRLHRNHPSIIMWSLGNEEMSIQHTEVGKRILRTMKKTLRRHDSSRPVTVAVNGGWDIGDSFAEIVDVLGGNYLNLGDPDILKKNRPELPQLISEACSHVCTRGEYEDSVARNVMSAYDRQEKPAGFDDCPEIADMVWPSWGRSAESMWKEVVKRPHVAGTFVWTGIDYRGEQTPFGRWPCTGSNFGIMDACCFPKDSYYYYKSWWTDTPVLHVFPHWNHSGREGDRIEVWAHTNCVSVELLLNGKSLGTREVELYGHAVWMVNYEPGKLVAIGITKTGIRIETYVETTTDPVSIILSSDENTLTAGSGDVAMVNVSLADLGGRHVHDAQNLILFEINGSAKILGVGNGDPRSIEPDKATQRHLFNGYAQIIIQPDDKVGVVELIATSDNLKPASIRFNIV